MEGLARLLGKTDFSSDEDNFIISDEDNLIESVYPNKIKQLKNDTLSDSLRHSADKKFEELNIKKALKGYNDSIRFANHPSHETSDDTITGNSSFKTLARGYANRSAVYFHIGMYDKCLDDIKRSVKYGHPKKSKLALRYCKALIEATDLNNDDGKKRQVTEQLMEKVKLDLNYNFNVVQEKNLYEYPPQYQSKPKNTKAKNNQNFISQKSSYDEYGLDEFIEEDVPELGEEQNNFHGLSNNLKLEVSEELGRHFVAEKDICPGTVLIVEEPYAAIPKQMNKFCSKCLAPCDMMVIPCYNCTQVVFCSEGCRRQAYTTFHRVECTYLRNLNASMSGKYGENATSIALRVILKAGLSQAMKFGADLRMQDECLESTYKNSQAGIDSRKFDSICCLKRSEDNVSENEMTRIVAACAYIAKDLQKTSFYEEGGGVNSCGMLVIKALIVCTLMINLNAMSSEVVYIHSQVKQRKIASVGTFLCGLSSMFSHSCSPNATYYYQGSKIVVRAISFIKKGSVVNIAYAGGFLWNPIWERQLNLEEKYHFKCRCEACVNNWHEVKCECSICLKVTFKCLNSHCDRELNRSGKCSACGTKLAKNQFIYPKWYLEHVTQIVFGSSEEPRDIESKKLIPLTTFKDVMEEYRKISSKIPSFKAENLGQQTVYEAYIFLYFFEHYVSWTKIRCQLEDFISKYHVTACRRKVFST